MFKIFALCPVACLLCVGCDSSLQMRGNVSTKADLEKSDLYHLMPIEPPFLPIPNARIYIAQTASPEEILDQLVAKTDKDGNYHIDVSNIPKSTDALRYYLIVASADGFETHSEKILIGSRARFIRNSIYLRKR